MAMSQIRPELGRQDWSPIARGGQAFGQGVGQGLAQLGVGIGRGLEKRAEERKRLDEQNKKFEATIKAGTATLESLLQNPKVAEAGLDVMINDVLMKSKSDDLTPRERATMLGGAQDMIGNALLIGKHVMEQQQLNQPGKRSPYQSKDVYELPNGDTVTSVFDPNTGVTGYMQNGTFSPLPEGAKRQEPKKDLPASIREWEIYSAMTKEQQQQYRDMKRQNPGSTMVQTADGIFLLNQETQQLKQLTTGKQEVEYAAEEVGAKTKATKEAEIAVERVEQKPIQEEALRQTMQDVEIMTSKIDEALEISSGWTTGAVGFPLSFIPGTPAYLLKQDSIATIKNKLSAKALADMRASSPTGGAVGQVTEKEWERLGTLVASLDIGIGEEALDKNLREIKNIYEKWGSAMQEAYAKDMARDAEKPPQPDTPSTTPSFATLEEAEAANLPVGSRVVVDGVEYEVQ
jgi:hypothetical protein